MINPFNFEFCKPFYHVDYELNSFFISILGSIPTIRFALFTIRPLVARFEVTERPWWIKKGRSWNWILCQ